MNPSSFLESAVIDGNILTIRPRGDLDTISAPEFNLAVQKYLDAGHSKIIIDCQRMGYISSVGISSLIALQARLKRKGGVVKLAAIQGPVIEVIRLMRLDKLLDIYGDLEFARQSFETENHST